MITEAIRTTATKALKMLLDLLPLKTVVETVALGAAYCLLRPSLITLEIGHNQMWLKEDKVDSKFNMTEDYTTLRHTFGKYRMVVPNMEE